ncbi:DUF3320 domain-containing protein [Zavarzinia compransoris]|uniref:DNA helicase n=1 Tax=Zavarzinia compransoris TaxID=1264899 RepID=A0A317DXQ7_9PROT|nr:DUF3320 domain-containing protein [Zavarzinia compransoris]PWR17605.1 DNA helicase [Zavarzinia compransoris]TDP44099.1 AAA domain-containing protein [Zavarzinia compransoris]
MESQSTDSPTSADTAETATGPQLVLTAMVVQRVNFASAQNGVGVLKTISLRNGGDTPIEGISVVLSCQPPVLRPREWRVDRIAPSTEVPLRDLATPLDMALLYGLNEAEIGTLDLTVRQGNETILHEERRIELLARDEWGGLPEMDEILAAFVSPNDPVVAGVLKEASRLLERGGFSGSLDGYQSGDPGRVWMLAGAIWSAVTGMGLAYAVPPASFETVGQKVRDPGRIAAEGLATCLDTALLMAGALEAAGLNAAVLFSQGHAWAGVWLVKRDFGRMVEPDVIALRKAVVAREFVPFETTLLTRRPAIGFDEAVDAGKAHLAEEREADFLKAIDISRARAARIRPLASHRGRQVADAVLAEDARAPAALPRPIDFDLLPGDRIEEEPTTPLGRIERWQRKLLDLSLGNRLLNFRETRQTVPLICPEVAGLEDALADGQSFRLLALADEGHFAGRDLLTADARRQEDILARDAMERRQIACPLTGNEMNNRLIELYRKARSDAQEGGTNTLFLAAGFLRWKRNASDLRDYRAPLLLIPVKLERSSARSDFRLTHHEDDIRVNSTLLEFLKRHFELKLPELEGELPRDQSGIDIPRIFETVRHRVRDAAGFEVVDNAALSTFSFAKYLMWKDLVDRTDSLRHSRLVRHLVDCPTEVFPGSSTPMPVPEDIDRRLSPGDLLTPLPADSSQLAAVVAAGDGRDFVLIGPPGTGKSQTIANIIADQLGRGKTVLFVAEKMAALDVVHRRLEAHGLGDACLELHSSKADRKNVLAQLGRSWDRVAESKASDWVRVSDDLRLTRDQLNAYVAALHHPGTQGFSVFDAIGRTAAVGLTPFALSFRTKDCHNAAGYQRLRDLSAEVGRRHRIVGAKIEDAALALVGSEEWSFAWEDEFLRAAAVLHRDILAAKATAAPVGDAFGLNTATLEAPELQTVLDRLAKQLREQDNLQPMAGHDLTVLGAAIAPFRTALAEYGTSLRSITAVYPAGEIATMPLERLELEWREAQTKAWPFAALGRRRITKLLQTYAVEGQADPSTDIVGLRRMVQAERDMAASPLAVLPQFAGKDTNLATIARLVLQAVQFTEVEAAIIGCGIAEDAWRRLRPRLTMAGGGPIADVLARYLEAEKTVAASSSAFVAVGGCLPADMTRDALCDALAGLPGARGAFSDWTKWQASRNAALAAGIEPLVRALESGAIVPDAAAAFEAAYMAWWLRLAMDASKELRSFAYWEHEALVERFRKLDEAAAEIASREVMRCIVPSLPARDTAPRNSELGALRHQLGLQRPSMPIRALIGQMPNSFSVLAPCVLMSPLSVAQYLPPGQSQFDLVIFDEASQITTWDAIGAIARGRQAIVVGDPRQLPPTNFFGRTDEDGDDLPEYEKDMPSILDEVVAAGVPTRQLNWHYRSRDETLIAFSNHFYYGNHLVTFPASDGTGSAVAFHQIDGTYARGKGRVNEAEAKAVVAMIAGRLNSWLALPEAKRPTLGVITFNAPQQSLILDLLDEERRKQPAFEWFFADDREEPLIVKNLENIQGDERDVMLFSITFGPDLAGKLPMNFGAINGDGGEKRLNVAVTRARSELHVFASVRADQIDLSRTAARGVADLKAFLDFAERGPIALPARDRGSLGPVESPFEEAVAAALSTRGWDVRTQIGVSDFRIDLGIVHPDFAGRWLAGVECDGARYHRSATARDRDKLRQAVLERLGWTILRLWSTDWFRNGAAVADRLDQSLRDILSRDRDARAREEAELAKVASAPAPEKPPAQVPDPPPDVAETTDDTTDDPQSAIDDGPETPSAAVGTPSNAIAGEASTRSDALLDPARFFDPDYDSALRTLIATTIAQSGPMPLSVLARRVAQAHGWQRTGHRIQARVLDNLSGVEQHDEFGTTFVWAIGSYTFRRPFGTTADRPIREISRSEIAALHDQHAPHIDAAPDPTLELARLAGVARLSADARAYLEQCIGWRIESEGR